MRCFQAASALRQPALVQVEVLFEDVTLPDYLCVPETTSGDGVPAVIDVGGIDAFAEEQYFKIGAALIERGYAVLLLMVPGRAPQNCAACLAGMTFETVAAAAVDYLHAQPGVDGRRFAPLLLICLDPGRAGPPSSRVPGRIVTPAEVPRSVCFRRRSLSKVKRSSRL